MPVGMLRSLSHVLRAKETGLVGVVLAMGAALAICGGQVERDGVRVNTFLQPVNLDLLFKETAYWAIMAVGATMVIVSGGIDLSIGSIYCLAGVLAALFFQRFGPAGPWAESGGTWVVVVGSAICLAAGMLCGLLNGAMVVLLRVHPFIITLGTMAIYRGIAFVMTGGESIRNFPPGLTHDLVGREIAGLYPVPALIMIVVVVCGAVFMGRTVWGRYIYAIGGNEMASIYSGVRVGRIKLLVYALAGLCAGISALILLGDRGAVNSNAGSGYELHVIAAAVVGGASLSGGRGTALGAFLGALIIKLIEKAIIILNVNQEYSRIIIGVVIILAVLLDRLGTMVFARRTARGR